MQWSIRRAAEQIKNSKTTPVELVTQCLDRIDRREEQIHAWVLIDREGALAAAREAGDEISRGRHRGPLHGMPIAVKDIYDVFDWPTAAGSKLWSRSIARADATVITRLRQAGAILLGKTVTTQYASFDPPSTRNPWNLERTPGGSSSGSAAALAEGMCLGALGSQTGGSITRPASYCGVAGCKPTFGRVSTAGVVPLAPSMDHPGPMALCVYDLAALLQVMAGPDPYDPGCAGRTVPDYTAMLNLPLVAPRMARVYGLFDDLAAHETREFMQATTEKLQRAGAKIDELALPAAFAEVVGRHRVIMAVEAARFHGTRLRRHPDDYAPRITELLEEGLRCSATEYAHCKNYQIDLTKQMSELVAAAGILLTPATLSAAPDKATTGDPVFNSPWSLTGLPTVSIPAGYNGEGLPLAIQLVGPPWGEAELLAAAAWCEATIGFERRK